MKNHMLLYLLAACILLFCGCSSKNSDSAEAISAEEAKEIALEQVPGATSQDLREFHSDYDNGRLHYDVEIIYDQNKYEFEIDAYNGDILEWNQEKPTFH